MKGKFDAYVLWPLTKKFQKRIVSAETIRGNTVIRFFSARNGFLSEMTFQPEMTFHPEMTFQTEMASWQILLKRLICDLQKSSFRQDIHVFTMEFFFQMNLPYFLKYWKVWLAFNGWKLSGLFSLTLFSFHKKINALCHGRTGRV